MPSGSTRPYGHIGSVDGGDEGGSTPPASRQFLSTIYAAGVFDDPSVDNLMTGTLQQFFVNLGATPPPFQPTNEAFVPESALFVGESPADTGIGADAKPLWRYRRHFSTFPSVGDQVWRETRYDLFAGGINTISGGDRDQHVLIDQFENRLTFGIDTWQLTRPGLNAPGYTPTYLDNAPVAYHEIILMDALGGGNTNDWQFNSDGSQFRRVLIPNVTGSGGGPAGPWTYVADAMSMWSRNGGEPLVGSRLFYDAVTAQTFGAVDTNVGQLMFGEAVVLDAKNLGSGQAAGHGERWARSTLGGPFTLVAQIFDDGYIFPEGFGTLADAAITGDLSVSERITGRGGGDVTLSFDTPASDLAALTSGVVIAIPSIPGFYPRTTTAILYATSGAGTCTTGPTLSVGNNAAEDNVAASTAMSAATVNAAIAAGFPSRLGSFGIPTGTTTRQLANLSTPATLKITVAGAGTGGFALHGYVNVVVTLAPV
jgi:hypothetical protein